MTLTLDELDAQIKDLQAQRKALAKKEGIPTIVELFAPFFKYPIVESVQWTQYTPFWNDGEPCEFNVHNYLSFNGEEDEEYEGDRIVFQTYQIPKTDEFVRDPFQDQNQYTTSSYYNSPEHVARRKREHEEYQDRREREHAAFKAAGLVGDDAKSFLKQVKLVEQWLGAKEAFLLDAFGDHCKVVVTRGGVEVEEYEHD